MIKAEILSFKTKEGVDFYEFKAFFGEKQNSPLFMLSLSGTDAKVGDVVGLNFKSSDVIIALNALKECSISNEIACEIISIKRGEILSALRLKSGETEFESIISAASCDRLGLCAQMKVFAYVKASSLYIEKLGDKNV